MAEIAAGFTRAGDFKFLELRNTGLSRVNLWGARFTMRIDFTYPEDLDPALAELDPAETILLVANPAAFAFRHDPAAASRVAGGFSEGTNLSNSGERLVMIDAMGGTILDFRHADVSPWRASADGGGESLHFLGGSPGVSTSWFTFTPSPGSVTADSVGDGQHD